MYIGIDIGGTKIKYAVLDSELNIVSKSAVSTDTDKGAESIMNTVYGIIEGIGSADAIGISTAGIVRGGSVYYANDNIKGYTDTNIQSLVYDRFHIKTGVYNDVNAAAAGEAFVSGDRNFFLITLGTGIGGGIIQDGKIYEGCCGAAGEIGYLPSYDGCVLDKCASTVSLERKTGMPAKRLFELARGGDAEAEKNIYDWCRHIAMAIFYVAGILNPPEIVIGGGVSEQADFLGPLIERQLKNVLPAPFADSFRLRFAQARNDAGIIGAVYETIRYERKY